jgi:hypothetical protein
MMREYMMMPLVSISDAQRAPMPWANWSGTVPHGLPKDLYHAGNGAGGYLSFLGRVSPGKAPDRAIEIATANGWNRRVLPVAARCGEGRLIERTADAAACRWQRIKMPPNPAI